MIILPETSDRVARDIYPLPLLPIPSALSDGVCRATGRRALRGRRHDQDAQFRARGLSACYLGTELSSYSPSPVEMQHDSQRMYPTSAAQFQVISHIRSSVRALGPPPEGMTPAGALNELRGSVSGYSDAPKGTRTVSYKSGELSIPTSSCSPVPLATLWDHGQPHNTGQNIIDSFSKHKILPRHEAVQRLSDSGVTRCFSDPVLRQPKTYAKFLGKLSYQLLPSSSSL